MAIPAEDFRPKFSNLVDLLRSARERYAGRPLFGVLKGEALEWTTYEEFGKLVDAFRSGLATLGIGRGDRVAVISNNRLEWAVGAHAVYSLGAAYVPMYEAQLDKEWQYILGDSDAKACLVANGAIKKRVEALRPSLPKLTHIIDFEGEASDPSSYAGLLTIGRSHSVPAATPAGDDIASLIYTSGTTGNPKGVMLSHLNLSSNLS